MSPSRNSRTGRNCTSGWGKARRGGNLPQHTGSDYGRGDTYEEDVWHSGAHGIPDRDPLLRRHRPETRRQEGWTRERPEDRTLHQEKCREACGREDGACRESRREEGWTRKRPEDRPLHQEGRSQVVVRCFQSATGLDQPDLEVRLVRLV